MAHHVAGHLSFSHTTLQLPTLLIPLLRLAFRRACEYIADRIAASLVSNKDSIDALITIASGSKQLIRQISPNSFMAQEEKVPSFFGFLKEIISTHPRLTKRIIAINMFYPAEERTLKEAVQTEAGGRSQVV